MKALSGRGRPSELDPKFCFDLILECETAKVALEEYNKRTGENRTCQSSITRSAKLWVLFHQEEARELYINSSIPNYWAEDDFLWAKRMVDYAFHCFYYAPKRFSYWLFSEQNDSWRDDYAFLYQNRFAYRFKRPVGNGL